VYFWTHRILQQVMLMLWNCVWDWILAHYRTCIRGYKNLIMIRCWSYKFNSRSHLVLSVPCTWCSSDDRKWITWKWNFLESKSALGGESVAMKFYHLQYFTFADRCHTLIGIILLIISDKVSLLKWLLIVTIETLSGFFIKF
jgi:hypothetical protein